MAVVFEGEVKIKLNRQEFMGDGLVLEFPEFLIFSNTGNKYTLQWKRRIPYLQGTAYESVTDAYIAARVEPTFPKI
jgi:hypothetical protein